MRLAGYNLEDTCRTTVTLNERPILERVMAGRDDIYCPEADSGMGQNQTFAGSKWMSALPPKADIKDTHRHVCFSNRPFGVKHFQTIHHCSVDVAHGLLLLFGIGTKALPLWDSRMRCAS